jgi:PEP-CTERM motif
LKSYLQNHRSRPLSWRTSFRAYLLSLAVAALAFAQPARADIINFDTEPALPSQPNTFATAGSVQTYTKLGVYTITGGVVLGGDATLSMTPGDPVGLPAFAGNGGMFGSAPNLYGTADTGTGADPTLSSTIVLTLPSSANITSVAFTLFNGNSIAEDYHVSGIGGGAPFNLDLGTLADVTDPLNSVVQASVSNPAGITEVDFFTPNFAADGWDFFVDDIMLTRTRGGPAPVPEPSTLVLFAGLGPAALGYAWRRRKAAGAR